MRKLKKNPPEEYKRIIKLMEIGIDKLRKKIQEREQLLKTVDMTDVIRYYDLLFDQVNLSISKVDSAYLKWQNIY